MKTILFTGQLWIIQNANELDFDYKENVSVITAGSLMVWTSINLVSVICVGGWTVDKGDPCPSTHFYLSVLFVPVLCLECAL